MLLILYFFFFLIYQIQPLLNLLIHSLSSIYLMILVCIHLNDKFSTLKYFLNQKNEIIRFIYEIFYLFIIFFQLWNLFLYLFLYNQEFHHQKSIFFILHLLIFDTLTYKLKTYLHHHHYFLLKL